MTKLTIATLLLCLASPALAADESHPHHIAMAAGGAWHGEEVAGYLGVDYAYRFENDFAVGAFAEEVSGDFDLRAVGLIFGKYFPGGFKFGVGPGVEFKIKKEKTLFLVHLSGGYDWHRGSWSLGPVASIDFVEDDSTTYYLGLSVGYGF